MRKQEKTELLTTRKNALLILSVLVLLTVIIFIFHNEIRQFWPSEKLIGQKLSELKASQVELQKLMDKVCVMERDYESFRNHSADFWLSQRDGNAETEAQKKIEAAAAKAGITVNSIGRVQFTKISDGIMFACINISTKAVLQDMAEFLAGLAKISPRFYWKSFSLRPENARNPQFLLLNGNIQFITITDEDAVRVLTGVN